MLLGTTVFGGVNFDPAGLRAGQLTLGYGTVFEIANSGFVVIAINGATANQATTDAASLTPFAHVGIVDVNAGQTETVTVTPSSTANGTLSDPNSGTDGGSVDPNTGVYTVSGTAAQVAAAVDGLVFMPRVNQVAPGQTVTTGFTINVTDAAGATASDATTSVVATDVAVAPTIFGAGSTGAITPDTSTVAPFVNVTITDRNIGQTETVTVTPSTTADGTLSDPNAATDGGSVNSTTGAYTVTGTAAQVSAAVEGLVFTPTAHQVAPGQIVYTNFTINVTDTAGATASDSNTQVGVQGTRQAVQVIAPPANQTTTDEASVSPFAGFFINDPNANATQTVHVTLSNPADGALSNLGGGQYDAATGVYTVSGAAFTVNSSIEGLVFTPTAHQAAPGQTVTTQLTLSGYDLYFSYYDATTSVVATAVNDPPTIAGVLAYQPTTDEARLNPFAHVAIAEVDFGQTETVTVTPSNAANGALFDPYAASDGGTLNNGVYTVTGTAAQVTAALDGLVFIPTAHQVAPGQSVTTSFTINVVDTAGGAASDTTTSVTAAAVNDPPVVIGAVAGQTTTDEASLTPFAGSANLTPAHGLTVLSGVVIVEPDFGQTETVTVTLSNAANGALSNLDGGVYSAATGVYTVSGDAAQVTLAVDGLVFTPTAHQVAPGQTVTTDFTINVTDTAGATASDTTTSVIATATGTLVTNLHSSQDLLVYELYQAAFARIPDNAGFVYWAGIADSQHTSALTLADDFIASPEFAQKYGASPSNTTFVTELYANILGRTPDAGGLDYWIGQANAGQPRDQLLVDFATSPENVNLIQPHVANGFWTT